jgi:translation initiation factor IF-2
MIFGLFRRKGKPVEGQPIGTVVHYFPHVKAAVIKVEKGTLAIGDQIRIKGHTTDFDEKIPSMQIEHESVESVSAGQEVAVKVKGKTRRGDQVYKR